MKKLLLFLIMLAFPIVAAASEVPQNIIDKLVSQIPQLSEYEAVYGNNNNDVEVYNVNFNSQTTDTAQVIANKDGVITSYSVNTSNSSKGTGKRLPKVTKTDAASIAISFLENVASDIFSELNTKIYTNTYNNNVSAGFNIRFTRSVNGITYSNDSVSVWVDADSGRVMRYNRIWNNLMQFASADEIITDKQAEDYFKTNISLQARFNKKVENGKAVPYLVYVPANTGAIDAITGNAINQKPPVITNSYKEMLAMYEKQSATAIAVEGENAKQEGLITGREAQKYARQIPELKIDDDYLAEQAIYYKNTNDDYMMTIKYTKESYTIDVTLDAKTLDIIGFLNTESAAKKSIGTIDNMKVKTVTDRFLKTYMSKYTNELSQPLISVIEDKQSNMCVVLYERTVNGILYKSNSAQFLVNSDGDIISLSFIWDKVEFENPADAISINEAYRVFFKNVGLKLVYMRTPDNNAQLVYTVNPQVPAIISAKSGRLLSYDGKPVKPKRSLAYIGLNDHYAQMQATALADCDIFVSEGNVYLDDHIYQKDFIVLLAAISPDGMPIYEKQGVITDEEIDMIYNDFITKGVIDKNEVNPGGYVMRENAVKYLLRIAGYKNVAELNDIFKMPFADSSKILPELYGYVALARGMNLISGSNGYFYPKRNLSNADALVMIYNYLNRGQLNESI